MVRRLAFLTAPLLALTLLTACGDDEPTADLTIYSGRSQQLVGPLLEQFEEDTGITVEARYGDSAEMAATIVEEGDNSPADVYFGQDAGALGALAAEDRLRELDASVIDAVGEQYRSTSDEWVGVSGRARVLAYDTTQVSEDEIPDSVLGLTDPAWEGRIGWAPTNGSFQAFVTALRVLEGEEEARAWLEGIQDNDPQVYENNIAILEAVAAGEVDAGLVNHYYLYRLDAEGADVDNVENHFFPEGDTGSLVNVAGVGVVDSSDNVDAARQFVEYLLSEDAQRYFSEETFEIPLVDGVAADPALPDPATLRQPDIDLDQLEDLAGTLDLLTDVGAI